MKNGNNPFEGHNIIFSYTRAMAIADGVGACPFSDRGASIAVNTAVDKLKNSIEEDKEWYKDPLDLIRQAFEAALTAVKETAEDEQAAYPLFDSTLTAVIYDGHKAYIGHIGDSRIYQIRNNKMERVTTDHSYVEKLVRDGEITREESYTHPKKNLLIF